MAIIMLLMALAVVIVTLLSCVSDIRSLRIPNLYSLIVLACFIPACLAEPKVFSPLWYYLAAMGLMFILSCIMFFTGVMGGGDSKLGTALALWVGLKGLVPFLFYMAIMGGVMGGLTLVLQKKKLFKNPKPGSWIEQAQAGKNAVPYGVAISFGFWMSFFHTDALHHQLNEVFKIIH